MFFNRRGYSFHAFKLLVSWDETKVSGKETNLKLAFKRGRRGDNRNAVTVLSHVAVTSLLIHNQRFKCKYVTGDSKIPLFNGSSSNSVLFYF